MITLQIILSSFFTMMWDFASVVGMQDLALLLPPIPLYAAGYIPPFDLDLSAAGMHNITTVVSNVTDGLPNGTVRCYGCEHLPWMLLPPFYNAQHPARVCFQAGV